MANPPALYPFVFRFGRVGDMIMLTAVLRLLHARYGNPCHVVGAGPWNEDVFLGHPDVARTWTFTRHTPFPLTLTWPRILTALHRSAPGPIYVCEYQYRQLPRIKRMLAWSGVDPNRCVYIDDDPARGRHWVDSLLHVAEMTPPGLSTSDYPVPSAPTGGWSPQMHVLPNERARCAAWLEAQGWTGRPIVLIQPGNHRSMSRRRDRYRRLNSDNKAWPIERWIALAQEIHTAMPEALIVLRGAVEEVPLLQEIQTATKLKSVVVAGLGLRDTFALTTLAHSMISVDTGPAHAAAALGVPLVVLYGAESPAVWIPRSPTGSRVLSAGGPPTSMRADAISVETVLQAWCRLLDSPAEQATAHRAAGAV